MESNTPRAEDHGSSPHNRALVPDLECCDQHTLQVLEYPLLLERLGSLCASDPGRDRALALRPTSDLALCQRRLRRLTQLRQLLAESSWPQLGGLFDLTPYLNRLAVDGAFLSLEELRRLTDFLAACQSASSFLAPAEERFDELYRLYNQITPLPDLSTRIGQLMGPGGEIASSASPELARIRKELGRARDRLRSQLSALVVDHGLEGVFSDQLVTQRAGRFVVPVKTGSQSKVPGIIHATSNSGATCFIEPLAAIEGNNALSLLAAQEQEEQARILRELAADLAQNRDVLAQNLFALAKLDCLLAQARLAGRLDCCEPRLNTNGEVDLLRARHPHLAWRQAERKGQAVPIGLAMTPQQRTLMISGANAGGKTAALKTVGLVCLMVMTGLQVPCDRGSRVPVFRRVLAEIGDEQDLGQDLSTFTAHAGRLAQMVKAAGRGSLLLIDELGNGTDPGEGAALGVAVLEWLQERGARTLVTTHFHRLKAFAAVTKGVENVSVAFDDQTGQPTYQLHYGSPGFSDALAVAGRLGFPRPLVERATQLVDADERQTINLLQQAEKERQRAASERGRAAADRIRAAEELAEARKVLAEAQKEKSGALAEGKRRVREVAKRMETRLEELFVQAQKTQGTGGEVKAGRLRQDLYEARRQAQQEVEHITAPPTQAMKSAAQAAGVVVDPTQLSEGDAVQLTRLGQSGVLLETPKPGAREVAVGVGVAGVRLMVALDDLEKAVGGAKKPATPPVPKVSVLATAGDGLDLNLVGNRVDDAIDKLDKALDQALLAGQNQLTVIHGVGTGRLKAGLREYLESHPYVTAIKPASRERGGAGATVVELRG